MLTGFKVLPLTCHCEVYSCEVYRPEHNAKGGLHETEFERFWNAEINYNNS